MKVLHSKYKSTEAYHLGDVVEEALAHHHFGTAGGLDEGPVPLALDAREEASLLGVVAEQRFEGALANCTHGL